ncbi:MAG TPA: DHA2 family efflux MFS transporter permease subunit [Gemmatimonadaceae bacterium]|nr:DHA2 family efflux MFS transporter permease subunit [Gemmatimonadaceae bacterium]
MSTSAAALTSTPEARAWIREQEARKWVIAGTVLTGTVMAVLDSSIVNVALPDMSGTLGVTIDQITWVVTGYILANVIIMPILALLSSRFGRKRFYMASVVAFTVASMLCGISRSLPEIVVWRILQGLGGGVMITVAQAILRETFPISEQGMAMGIYGMGVVLAPAIGPTLGGWLVDQYSWPWVFYINVPIGVLNILLVSKFIEDPPYLIREKGKIDFLGLGLMTIGLGALQLMLEKGQEKNWFQASLIIYLAVIAAAGLIFFIWRELTTDRPAVDLRILKNASFTSATSLGGVLGAGLYGSLFLLPLFLQNLLGYTAMLSGLALMPRSLAMAVVMPIGGRFYNKLGPRILVGMGLVVSAFSFWELSRLSSAVGFWDIFWPQVWQGVGFSLIFVALSTAALATIPKPKMTAATGLYNVVRQVFGSVGIALAATEITGGTARYHDILSQHITMFQGSTRQFLQQATAAMMHAGADAYTAAQRALALLDGKVTLQAAVLAYNHVFWLITLLFIVVIPLVFFLSGGGEAGEIMMD